jgi:hypothetical protein
MYTLQKSSSPSKRQAIFKVEIYMKFVHPVVDAVTAPLPRVRPPLRPYFSKMKHRSTS